MSSPIRLREDFKTADSPSKGRNKAFIYTYTRIDICVHTRARAHLQKNFSARCLGNLLLCNAMNYHLCSLVTKLKPSQQYNPFSYELCVLNVNYISGLQDYIELCLTNNTLHGPVHVAMLHIKIPLPCLTPYVLIGRLPTYSQNSEWD
jgi:sorbitol-specific phosphotransferase system component IIC